MSDELNILLTNDDGYQTGGIHSLADMMRQFGRITAVAPKFHQSGMSMAVSMGGRAIAYKELPTEDGVRWSYLDATPASCVKYGLDEIFWPQKPDVVVCGINHGSNAATAANYSGTLGAAEEAALNGTGYEAQFSGMHIAGKTGSTNSNKDRYFVGYTPYYSCAVWAGYEHNQRIVASGNPCSAIFRKVMSAIHEELPDKDFFSCAGLTSVAVCADSGMLASDNCALDVRGSRVYTALVAADNAPTSVCTMHTAPSYTVNMADSDGNVTTVTGSVLNYQRELIEGHEEIVVEDGFMMLGGWNGFFGDYEENNDVNTPNGDHDDTMDDSVPDRRGFLG